MIDKALIALVLGFSLERLFTCPFLAMSLSLTDRWAGLKFILGRAIGIVGLGILITIISIPLNIPFKLLDGIFGLLLVIMGVEVILFAKKMKQQHRQFKQASFGLGLFRGLLNPGRKIIYLFPLLIGVNPIQGIVISFFYALGSSVLLAAGFASGEILNRFFYRQDLIRLTGGVILILLGFYYFIKVF